MKDSSNTLSLTFEEFCHIRNVITRAELETLLFDEKLYAEVAQGKVKSQVWIQQTRVECLFLVLALLYLPESTFQFAHVYLRRPVQCLQAKDLPELRHSGMPSIQP